MTTKLEQKLVVGRVVDLINELQETQNQQALLFDSLLNSFQELLDIQSDILKEIENQ